MSGPPRRLLARALLALCCACGGAQFIAPPDPGPRAPAAELRDSFSDLLDLTVVDGRCAARLADGRLVEVVGEAGIDDPVFATPIGRVAIDDWLILRRGLDPLIARVDAAPRSEPSPPSGAATAPFRVDFHPLLGAVLRLHDQAIADDGAWRVAQDPSLPRWRAAVRAELDAAVAAFGRAPFRMPPLDRDALVAVVARAAADRLAEAAIDELQPAEVRRMIRRGWLADVFGLRVEPLRALPAIGASVTIPERRVAADRRAARVEAAVVAACAPHDAETWSRGGEVLLRMVDAFDRESWFLHGDAENTLAARPPHAGFGELDWDFPDDGWVVLTLDPRADPKQPLAPDTVRSARSFENAAALAAWTPDGGLDCDPSVWRAEVPVDGVVTGLSAVDDYLPPHIVLTDALGDVLALLTAHGALVPPADRRPGGAPDPSGEPLEAAAERFLADAARVLPDAAHLDLLGQYLVAYAFDGPDPRRPEILGTGELQGDRHQTAAETLATARGGVCAGDCDDLAEIYVDVLRRQGRHALALGVPGHMFAASARRTPDGWAIDVLQTGLAETHRAGTLDRALDAALRAQDPTRAPDLLHVEAWPRVDGAPLRTRTWIDPSAMRDPDRAAAVVADARRESHGLWAAAADARLQQLERLEPAEPLDRAAAHARLAEATAAMGRFDAALDHATRAAALCGAPATRLGEHAAALAAALGAGRSDSAAEVARAIDDDLGRPEDAPPHVIAAVALLDAYDALEDAADGGREAAALAAARLPEIVDRLEASVTGTPEVRGIVDPAVLDVLDRAATTAARAARRCEDSAARDALLGAVRRWVALVRGRGELGTWSDHAAVLATLRRDDPDALVASLAVARPSADAPDFADPGVDVTPWLAGSVVTWEWELRDRLAGGQPTPSTSTLRTLTRGLQRAASLRQSADDLDEADAHARVFGALCEAVLLGDDGAAAAAWEFAATWIPDRLPELGGDLARLAPRADIAVWLRAVEGWLATGGRARDAFTLVWATQAAGAHAHALAAADLVCARLPDAPELADERGALRALTR